MNCMRATRASVYAGTVAITLGSAAAQDPKPAPVEPAAGTWHTWVIPAGSAIAVRPPPDADASRAELDGLKSRLVRDGDAMHRIAYWDRGWPGYRWQEIAAAELQANPRPSFWHTMAILSVAVHDTTVATWHAKYQYGRQRPSDADPSIKPAVAVPRSPSYPSEHAAVAAAAADVLAFVFPDRAGFLAQRAEDAAQSRIAAGVQYESDVEAGLAIGHQVAASVIARVKADRSDTPWDGKLAVGPNLWAGTNPFGVTRSVWVPWSPTSPDQFLPPPPPKPGSPELAAELAEVKQFQRTPATRRASYLWAVVPELREWITVTNLKLFESRQADNPPFAARTMALLMVASDDSFEPCFEAKYRYMLPRPFQLDPSIDAVVAAPSHPSYPSGHGCGDGAAEVVLSDLFPNDAAYFKEHAEEGAWSRMWAGIHFRSDIEAGLALGRAVGRHTLQQAAADTRGQAAP